MTGHRQPVAAPSGTDLLPCSFCGAQPKVSKCNVGGREFYSANCTGVARGICNVGPSAAGNTPSDAGYWWNRRHTPEPQASVEAPPPTATVPDPVRNAIERLLPAQEELAAKIDAANPGDPWASLSVRDDIDLVRTWLGQLDAKKAPVPDNGQASR